MKYKLLYILLFLSTLLNAQNSPFDNESIFGEYHLVTNQASPYNDEIACNYTTTYSPQKYSMSSSPRKAKSSGSGSVTSDDGTVTITYTWVWSGLWTYTITYSDGTSETIHASQWTGDNMTTKAYEAAKEKANEIAEERRMAAPIGEPIILFIFAGIYCFNKYKNEHLITKKN